MKDLLKQIRSWKKQSKSNAQRYFEQCMPISESAALSEINAYERVENYILRNLENGSTNSIAIPPTPKRSRKAEQAKEKAGS